VYCLNKKIGQTGRRS